MASLLLGLINQDNVTTVIKGEKKEAWKEEAPAPHAETVVPVRGVGDVVAQRQFREIQRQKDKIEELESVVQELATKAKARATTSDNSSDKNTSKPLSDTSSGKTATKIIDTKNIKDRMKKRHDRAVAKYKETSDKKYKAKYLSVRNGDDKDAKHLLSLGVKFVVDPRTERIKFI